MLSPNYQQNLLRKIIGNVLHNSLDILHYRHCNCFIFMNNFFIHIVDDEIMPPKRQKSNFARERKTLPNVLAK